MIFTIDGQEQPKLTWLHLIVGSAATDSFQRLDSVEMEGEILYLSTKNGAVIAFRIYGLRYDCIVPPKKWGGAITLLREEILKWDAEMQRDPIHAIDLLNQYPRRIYRKMSIGTDGFAEIGLGDLPISRRDFEYYESERLRKHRKEWHPHEKPLCPQCISNNVGFDVKDRHWCRQHLWVDETVYDGFSFLPGDWPDFPKTKHINGPIKAYTVQKPVEVSIDTPPPSTLSELQDELPLLLDFRKPAPESFTDVETLRAFGNREIAIQQIARACFDREQFRYSRALKEWAEWCLDEGSKYLKALRDRMQELMEPIIERVVEAIDPMPVVETEETLDDIWLSCSLEELQIEESKYSAILSIDTLGKIARERAHRVSERIKFAIARKMGA